MDTFQTAKQIDDMIPLLTKDDTERIKMLQKLVEQNVDLKALDLKRQKDGCQARPF